MREALVSRIEDDPARAIEELLHPAAFATISG